jgi:hypothetical protein
MRSSLLLIAFLSSLALFSQQADIWKSGSTDPADQPKTVTPSPQPHTIDRTNVSLFPTL